MTSLTRSRLLVGGFVSLAMVAVACSGSRGNNLGQGTVAPSTGPSSTAAVKEGGTLNYGADQEPTGFNTNTRKDNSAAGVNVVDRIWPTVFHQRPDFTLSLDKALMVSADVTNQSPQTVVYKINPDASWADGVPITADDFIYFWKMQKDPSKTTDSCTNGCPSNGKPVDDATDGTGYKNISGIVASDNGKTVTVTFSSPFADWKSLFSTMLPAHIAQKVGWNDGFDKYDPAVIVSGGPYKLQSYNPGKDLTLVPNDKYWGTRPHLDSLVYHFFTDPVQQLQSLQNKIVDMIYPQPKQDQVKQVKQITDVNSEISFGPSFEHLDFNAKAPSLDDLVVRQAIATAIARSKLLPLVQLDVAQLSSGATVLNNRMFVTNQPEYSNTSGGAYDKADPVRAKQMLGGDGYALGSDGIYAKAGKRLSFRVLTAGGDTLDASVEALMQADVKAAGIDFKIDKVDTAKSLSDRLSAHDFDIALLARRSTPFPTGNNALYSQAGGNNYGQFGNAALDMLLTKGAAELDRQKEADDYNAADKIMWDNMWTLPLFQKPTFIAVRNTFVNVHDNSTAEGPFWNSETWGLKTSTQ